jgi:uncharacterized protein YpmB
MKKLLKIIAIIVLAIIVIVIIAASVGKKGGSDINNAFNQGAQDAKKNLQGK